MGNKKSKASVKTNTQANANNVSTVSKNVVANRRMNMKRMQNVLLIWLDSNINDNDPDCNNIIQQLTRLVNNVKIFTDDKQCVEFIQTTTNNKICMIVSGSLGQHIVPHVHNMSQVDTIFIFCNNQQWHKQWAKQWPKIKGVFTDITSICEALKQAAHQCEQNAISISIVAPNNKLDQLDPPFMYTQILKEILLTINFEDKHIKEFITYYRKAFVKNESDLRNIEELERDYHDKRPIWWYTYQCFLYSMLNQALRLMDVDIILRMGFFFNDLHRDIQRLHSEQLDSQQSDEIFEVYRGQRLLKEDFTKMKNAKGGLLSFNNFLSTSKDRDVSLCFAPQVDTEPDLVGILFVISINPTHSTAPFASLTNVSHFDDEDEILFSMHTIFRIEDIEPIDEDNNLYQVNLTLTNNNDQDLRTLTDRIRQETYPNSAGWQRLGLLLIKMGEFNKAQEVYQILLHQTTHESDKSPIYNQLGLIANSQGIYSKAFTYYTKSLTICQKTLPSNHLNLAMSYSNIGVLYDKTGHYSKALSSHKEALKIRQQSLPFDHPDLAASYNNIGTVYDGKRDYKTALEFYKKALPIQEKSLPPNHPHLGGFCNNIGLVYENMGKYLEAHAFYKRAVHIAQQSLLPNHPNLQKWTINLERIETKL
ncbi:unnamed protein product [Adineta steineri]|uniref:Kinesin light chain n=1 Tax=Adineta steineri TaxID=433720 RepID=A0A819BD71_9BILA|nr:unnamed protein product [Adineta steineri]CAF1353064.1 unnamed protein product [Adineta steineri]CAF1425743.1 unnamed protein product [Adineta steineri]CAF3656572.1 unnamed protein product [Adineta steineri]CAF3787284.1 unnamed protein product [Adineta steineri]